MVYVCENNARILHFAVKLASDLKCVIEHIILEVLKFDQNS